MNKENVTYKEARETINHLVQGVDPYTGEVLEKIDFLQEPRMIRCFAVVSDLLTRSIEGQNNYARKADFVMDEGCLDEINLPEGEIGVMKLVNAINRTIDTHAMKRLSAFTFNRKLIEEGVLSYCDEEGSKRAVVNDISEKHGIKSIRTTYNGEEYDKVVYTEEGKSYVMDHLLKWFGPEAEDSSEQSSKKKDAEKLAS